MRICQNCGAKIISDDWDYCHKCGTEILRPDRAFVYEQLFELMKLQDNRRQHLDSKAHTYIGLLSIAVTIIVALGGLTIGNIAILSVLYGFTVLLFTIGVIVAFHAYHIGSPIIKNRDEEALLQNTYGEGSTDKKTKKVYLRLDEGWLIKNSDKGLVFLQKKLIHILGTIISENQKFNIQKSNNMIYAYYITIAAIISLLLLCVIIILNI